MSEINPDIIQIGNEPMTECFVEGKLSTNESKYIQLVQEAILQRLEMLQIPQK
jgi:arabinogalactan endo-1,4-beta-galactosidase